MQRLRVMVKTLSAAILCLLFLIAWGLEGKARVGHELFASPNVAQNVRRALLVGVGKYVPGGNTVCASEAGQLSIAEVMVSGRGTLRDLCGPLEDVQQLSALLQARYGFRPEHVTTLVNAKATRKNITDAIERDLIESASRGDTCLFYFSGHGSQRRNTLAQGEQEPDGMDETLVTVDVAGGVKDLRDKELALLYHRALDKGVNLIIISDSCHSGSIARSGGVANYQKNIRADQWDWKSEICPDGSIEACRANQAIKAELCPRPDPATRGRCLSPADRGALILSASQEDQPAEVKLYGGIWHGTFTYALLEALQRSDMQAASVKDLFYLIRTQLKADGLSQEPTTEPSIDGVNERVERKTLFGEQARPFDPLPVVRVKAVNAQRNEVILAAGIAYGLSEGSELYGRDDKTLRLYVERTLGLTEAVATLANGNISLVKTNDPFIQDRWVVQRKSRLRVRLPASNLSYDQVKQIASELLKLRESPRVKWMTDPTLEKIDAQIYYNASEWILQSGDQDELGLGASPTAQRVLDLFPATAGRPLSVLLKLPLASEVRAQLGVGTRGKTAVEVISSDAETFQYELWGRATGDANKTELEYSWVLRSAVGARARTATVTVPLPPITDWTAVDLTRAQAFEAWGRSLDNLALRLSKIRGIVTLSDNVTKATSDKSWFPYRLAIREKVGGRVLSENDVLSQGTLYEAVLVPEREAFARVLGEGKRWVYLFNVDVSGASRRFNFLGDGQQANVVVYSAGREPTEIVLKGPRCNARLRQQVNCRVEEHVDLQVIPPTGHEVFQLLVTATPLPDPSVLNMEGVRTMSGVKNFFTKNGLQSLLFDLSNSDATFKGTLPDEWWAQRLIFRSAPRQ